jgi:hypothetical protein
MFSDRIQAVKAMEYVGAAVKSLFRDPLVARHLCECGEAGVSGEKQYFRLF